MSSNTSSANWFFHLDQSTRTVNVEFWVVLTTLLLVLKFAIDSVGPWNYNKFMSVTAQFLEGFSNSMVQYTLGIMQLSSTKNDFFQVWAVLMVTLKYSVKVGRPYGRSNSKQLTLSDVMSSLWTANLLKSKTSMRLNILLWFIWSINAARIVGYFLSSQRASMINKENLRFVSDYMQYEHNLSDTADPVTMSGYKYLVSGEDKQDRRIKAPEFRFQLDLGHKKLITTESAWDRLDGSTLLGDDRFKDVCLSFALYKLLRRRFYDLPLHEVAVDHNKMRRLILDGVLQGGNDNTYRRAFRITEVELSFLQDSFHGNHAVMFVNGFPFRRLVLSGFLVASLLYAAIQVHHIPSTADESKKNVGAVKHGAYVSDGIIALTVGKEIWEICVYVFSQWTKVWMLCTYITVPKLQCSFVEKVVRDMFRSITRGQWNQQIGQYNLLIQCSLVKLRLSGLHPKTIKLQTMVKRSIFETMKGLQSSENLRSYLSNAIGSDRVLLEQLSWTNEFDSDTHRTLVWHIATCFCEIELCGQAAAASLKAFWLRPRLFAHQSRITSEGLGENYVIAVTLSNYCAYLLTSLPRLVPDNRLASGMVFWTVRSEVYHATRKCFSLQDIYDRFMGKYNGEDYDTVEMGAELARQLLEAHQENRAAVWQILAKFWTGFLLHLAASTKAAKHKTHLRGRGELITHLWALLSHAGFLGVDGDENVNGDENNDNDQH